LILICQLATNILFTKHGKFIKKREIKALNMQVYIHRYPRQNVINEINTHGLKVQRHQIKIGLFDIKLVQCV
ncbi:MAG: hypothetical protein CSA26_11785, partial [Desulfobacterales bacterium]